ncbi:MAG TPA: ribose ABC transporter permease [Opitutaceae bacterium]|nr:ribose ABC transporter permease [Opitutaceae bacterium]
MKVPTFIARHGRQAGTVAVFLMLCAVLSVLTPHFLTTSNLLNVAQQTVVNAIVAVGLTYVILSGGIDLSVGSVLALAGVVLGLALEAGWPLPVAIAACVLVGALCGVLNGMLVAFGRLPPFIATLGLMSIARGAALLVTDGRPVSGFDGSFRWLATGELLGVPVPVWCMLAVYVAAHVVLHRTRFGRYVFAIGGNEEATLLSGVPVARCKVGIYALGGGLAAGASVLLTARLNSAQPIAGLNYELDAIAATVIGGTSLLGGQGSVFGTLVGALIMGVLRNGLNLLGVSSFVQQVVIGAVIIAAVLLDTFFKRSRR